MGGPAARPIYDPFAVFGVFDPTNYPVLAGLSGVLYVNVTAVGGLGTLASPWTGWETAVNAAAAFTCIVFPCGNYLQTAIINCKAGQQFVGHGYGDDQATKTFGGSVITGAMAGSAFRTNYTDNTFRSMNTFRDLVFINTNGANKGSAILLVGGAFVEIERITVEGFKYGITNIGCTAWTIGKSFFEGCSKVGIWISNALDYTLTFADIDLSAQPAAFYGDVGSVRDCRFNLPAGAVCINLESQFAVTVDTCKFNGGDAGVWMTGMGGVKIMSSTFEAQFSDCLQLRQSRFVSGVVSGFNSGVEVSGANVFTPTAGHHCIKADVHGTLTLQNNTFAVHATALSVISGGDNIGMLFSRCNDYSITASATLVDNSPVNMDALDRAPGAGNATPLTLGLVKGVQFAAAQGGIIRAGSAVLAAGMIAVANTTVTAKTIVQYFRKTIGGTVGNMSYTISAGVGFTLTSSNGADTSAFDWTLIEGP